MTRTTRNFAAVAALFAVTSTGLSGCAAVRNMNQTERGAVIGSAGGAVLGAVIGKKVGNTAAGAIIGAAVGGTAGAVIGRQMDKQAEELQAGIPGATVQRVGEGIVVTFESGLLYPFNSTDLLPAGRENLRNLAESLRENPETEVLIVGHTDAVGSDAYNQNLSEQRASTAAGILSSNGIPRERIRTAGRGKSEPIASNDDEAGRQANRRVEIAIFASEAYRERLLRSNPGE